MVLLCPVCLLDKQGPIALPGCRAYHPAAIEAAKQQQLQQTQQQSGSAIDKLPKALEYASSCIIPTTWTEFQLVQVLPHNHDTSIFEFGLKPGQRLELPVCACMLLLAPGREHGGGDAVRPYTPISSSEMAGKFQLMIKRYREWGDPRWPHSYCPPGAVSNYLFELKPGAMVKFKHTKFNVKLPYVVDGVKGFQGVATITMIAVGVGLAPMIQALHEVLNNPQDNTKIVFLYGNRTVRDILLRKTLDEWSEKHSDQFRVVYTVGSRYSNVIMHANDCPKDCGKPCKRFKPKLPDGWEGLHEDRRELGWVNEEVIRKHAYPPSESTKVFVCGLPGVYEKLCGPRGTPLQEGTALHRCGYTDDMIVKF